ncbi:hypothetical protein [Xenorhabdus bovienii]|nr:hypothetical protein [Xenorhabdus bovienii]MDE9528312.1 hypothetical protein [Xenorhabdus bovienii]
MPSSTVRDGSATDLCWRMRNAPSGSMGAPAVALCELVTLCQPRVGVPMI